MAEALKRDHGITVEKRKIALSSEVEGVGEYEAVIKVHPEVTSTVKVHVIKSGE